MSLEDLTCEIDASIKLFCERMVKKIMSRQSLQETEESIHALRTCLHVHGDCGTTTMVSRILGGVYKKALDEGQFLQVCAASMVMGTFDKPKMYIRCTHADLMHRSTGGTMDIHKLWRDQGSRDEYCVSPQMGVVALDYFRMKCRWSRQVPVDVLVMEACQERGLQMVCTQNMLYSTCSKVAAAVLDRSVDPESLDQVGDLETLDRTFFLEHA